MKNLIVFSLFLISVMLTTAYSQSMKPYDPQEEKLELPTPREFDIDIQTQEKTSEKVLPPQQYLEQALEREIDSTTYILGPGDLLLVNVWSPMAEQMMSEITAEGYLVLPGILDVKISGLTLSEGKTKVKQNLQRYFKNTQFTVHLVKMRKFRVYIVGEIEQPGTYFMRGSERLSDLIEIATGFASGADDTRIQIRHTEGQTDTVDFSLFYSFGNRESNPHLQGGDVIYIPPVDLNLDYVTVEGNLESQGIYRIKQKETLISLLSRLKVLNRRSDIKDIVLLREGKKTYFDLLINLEEARTEILLKGDHIYIPVVKEYVYVQGEVFQPGAYPYMANFNAKDYAGMGGLRETAQSVDKISVIHLRDGSIEKGGNVIVQKGDVVVVPQRARENFKDILTILTPIISITISTFALILASK